MTRFVPVADHALLIEFATEISDHASSQVMALDHALVRSAPPGLIEVVPAFVNVLVRFDSVVTDHDALQAHIERLLPAPTVDQAHARTHDVTVCYEASPHGDLHAIAEATAMSPEAIIASHLAGEYRVGMYGFAPGYAYLSGTPQEIQLPRKASPVAGVAAGSVIIAGAQCLITTLEMPTGWWILGASPTKVLLDHGSDEDSLPVRFDVGDTVRFRRIDLAAYETLRTS